MRARRVSRRKKRIKTAAFRASTGGLGVPTPDLRIYTLVVFTVKISRIPNSRYFKYQF
jgi:hypothetical protein